MEARKKETVYQAGYSRGDGHWLVCGYGSTQKEAKENLKERIIEKALDSIIERTRKEINNPKGNHDWFCNHKNPRQWFEWDIEESKSGRYQEQSYENEVE